jgi:hypothetical protein
MDELTQNAYQQAEQERSRANQAQIQTEAAEQALRAEQARSQQMAALLRSMGIDPENLRGDQPD